MLLCTRPLPVPLAYNCCHQVWYHILWKLVRSQLSGMISDGIDGKGVQQLVKIGGKKNDEHVAR